MDCPGEVRPRLKAGLETWMTEDHNKGEQNVHLSSSVGTPSYEMLSRRKEESAGGEATACSPAPSHRAVDHFAYPRSSAGSEPVQQVTTCTVCRKSRGQDVYLPYAAVGNRTRG